VWRRRRRCNADRKTRLSGSFAIDTIVEISMIVVIEVKKAVAAAKAVELVVVLVVLVEVVAEMMARSKW
jgi:hypothetical protein